MLGHGGSSVGSYLADPTSPIPSHCASIVATSTLRVKTNTISLLVPGVALSTGQCYSHGAMIWVSLCCLLTPGLSKDIRCHERPYFSKIANHQLRHQATHKVGCQPGDCI